MSKIDRKGWKEITFGEVCSNVNDTIRNPEQAGIERYVGLEHIEPGSLQIKSWGNVADGTTFTKGFKPGQVLFGKRRAYQKKAALATFAGLCSGDILVLAPNEELIDKNLFPFLVASDGFFDYAVKTSAGSLSPRTKFQDLANYEFLLPPKAQQARIAELLWAADDVVQKYERVSDQLQKIIESVFDTVYNEKDVQFIPLGQCLEYSQYGISEQLSEEGEIPVLRMNNIVNRKISVDDMKFINKAAIAKLDTLLLEKGDILFNRTNSYELVGKVGIFNLDIPITFASYLIRLRVNKQIVIPEYLNLFLNSHKGQTAIKLYRTPGVSQSNVNPENLKKIKVPIIKLPAQKMLFGKIEQMENSLENNNSIQNHSKLIQKQLINQVFG